MNEIINIEGIEYKVELSNTPETHEAQGRSNLAREMKKNGVVRDLYISRKNGNRIFSVYQFKSGNFSKLTKISF